MNRLVLALALLVVLLGVGQVEATIFISSGDGIFKYNEVTGELLDTIGPSKLDSRHGLALGSDGNLYVGTSDDILTL